MQQAMKKSKTTTHSSIPHIPIELVQEIFIRLPLKSLLRFKSVSKSWHQLIMQQDTINLYHARWEGISNSVPESLFVIGSYDQCYYSNLPELDEAVEAFSLRRVIKEHDCDVCKQVRNRTWNKCDLSMHPIVGSSNGLVCIFLHGKLLLSNLVTGTHRFVKCLEIEESMWYPEFVFGFGYDRLGYDYKIVRIVYEGLKDDYNVSHTSVYSLNSDSWRSVRACTIPNFLKFFGNEQLVFVNGAVHCRAVMLDGRTTIASFDIHYESWGELLPPDLGGRQKLVQILRFSDCLSGLTWEYGFDFLWVMNEYGVKESWNVIYKFSHDMRPIFPSVPVFKKGTETWVLTWKSKLIRHDSRDNSLEEAFAELSPKAATLVANVPVMLSVTSKQSVKNKPPIPGQRYIQIS